MKTIQSISSAIAVVVMAFGFSFITAAPASPGSETCYYFAETPLDRAIFHNNRPSLSYLISNIVPASCSTAGGTRTDILNQFNEAVQADGRFGDAKFARIVYGPYQTRSDGLRAHRRHIANILSNNHVVTDFSFRYYRD
jgi:hypothetical protein